MSKLTPEQLAARLKCVMGALVDSGTVAVGSWDDDVAAGVRQLTAERDALRIELEALWQSGERQERLIAALQESLRVHDGS